MKTKKHSCRKGFTVIELVIVIAVIGILSSILIPTFIMLHGKAEAASNESFVRNINTQLAMNEADPKIGKSKTMNDAVQTAKGMGFDVTKITPYNGNDIIWDQQADRFAIVTSDFIEHRDIEHVVYKDGTFDINRPTHKLWKIYGAMPTTQNYSIYAREDWNATGAIDDLMVGFDAGEVIGIPSIEFIGNGTQKDLLLRTNGSTLTVNAPGASVHHYSFATAVDVNDVDSSTYHEHGTVGRLKYADEDGRIRFEEDSVTYCYMNKSTDEKADVSATTKAGNAEIYTNVSSTGQETVHEDKTVIVDANNEVEVATCRNHNTQYDVIFVGNEKFMVCKCCGGFTAYAEDPVTHEMVVTDASPEFKDEEGHVKEDIPLPGPNTAFGFANSYIVEEGTLNEHWVHEIETAEQFENLAAYIPSIVDLDTKTPDAGDVAAAQKMEYILTADIDMDEATGLGLAKTTFIGTLNGNGKTIRNYEFADTGVSGFGLLGSYYDKTVVKNLTIDYFDFDVKDFCGILFGQSWNHRMAIETAPEGSLLTLEDITIGEHSIIRGTKGIAGVVGSTRYIETVNATNVVNKADVVASIYNAGGLFGTVSGVKYINLINCKNYGSVLSPANVGGLVGQGGPKNALVSGCENHGRITSYSVDTNGKTSAGWFIGSVPTAYTYENSKIFLVGKVCYTNDNKDIIAIYEDALIGNGIAIEDGKTASDYRIIDDAVLMSLTLDANGQWLIDAVPNAVSYTISMQMYARDVRLTPDENLVTVVSTRGLTYSKKFASPSALHDGFARITRAGYVLNNLYTNYDYDSETTSYTSTEKGRANFFRLPYAQRGNYDLGNIHFDTSINEWVYVFDAQEGFPEGVGQILSPKDTYVSYVVSAYDASGHVLAVGRHEDKAVGGISFLKNMAGETYDPDTVYSPVA